jgi:hypothetical protein
MIIADLRLLTQLLENALRLTENERHSNQQELVMEYERIIPVVRFEAGNKSVDDFDTKECIICMDAFNPGEMVSRIQTCKHLFHPPCLMRWFSSPSQAQMQKCPTCNGAITVEELEAANREMGERT